MKTITIKDALTHTEEGLTGIDLTTALVICHVLATEIHALRALYSADSDRLEYLSCYVKDNVPLPSSARLAFLHCSGLGASNIYAMREALDFSSRTENFINGRFQPLSPNHVSA